jgi:hypothetical protein
MTKRHLRRIPIKSKEHFRPFQFKVVYRPDDEAAMLAEVDEAVERVDGGVLSARWLPKPGSVVAMKPNGDLVRAPEAERLASEWEIEIDPSRLDELVSSLRAKWSVKDPVELPMIEREGPRAYETQQVWLDQRKRARDHERTTESLQELHDETMEDGTWAADVLHEKVKEVYTPRDDLPPDVVYTIMHPRTLFNEWGCGKTRKFYEENGWTEAALREIAPWLYSPSREQHAQGICHCPNADPKKNVARLDEAGLRSAGVNEQKRQRERRISKSTEPPAEGQGIEIKKAKKKAILRAVELDPEHNLARVARQYKVSNTTVMRIAHAQGLHGGGGLRISDDKRAAVVALLPHARSNAAIAREVGVDGKTVARVKRGLQEENSQRPSRQIPPSRHLTLG